MASQKLLQEFPPVSTEQWEATIIKDLKGADPKKLIWKSDEGLEVKPFYRAEDLASLPHLGGAPGDFPYTRGASASADWRIAVKIGAETPAEANKLALEAVKGGAEEIIFKGSQAKNAAELSTLLAGLAETPVRFEHGSFELYKLLAESGNANAVVGIDPLKDLDAAAALMPNLAKGLTPFTLNGVEYEEAGGTAVEQLAFTLAAGIEYLAGMQERSSCMGRAVATVSFSFAVGSSYFYEIAKLRAFRLLWALVTEQFGAKAKGAEHAGVSARIFARTSRWNKTIYDPHVNVLRTTTEAMSAILGGADSVLVDPFDAVYKDSDEASQRLARNTQILLKEEAMLAHVADPGAGSYLIETLTNFLATEAWKRMQKIEAEGGFSKALASGSIANALKASLAVREKAVATRKRVFTGSNKYANPNEKILGQIDEEHLSHLHRGAAAYEQLRLRTERAPKTPKFLLAEIGDAKMRAARSGFASNFFACAGFALTTQRFATVEEIAATPADVYVLCSSDGEYLDLTKQLAAKTKTPIVIAGAPENQAELTAAGAVDFIHVRSNPIEVLAAWQKRLGIEG